MSNSVKEEEQLLQDASTLLMFANVAAKQQQQHPHNPSPPSNVSPPTVPKPEIPVVTSQPSHVPHVPSGPLPPVKTYHEPTMLGSPAVITPTAHIAPVEHQRLPPLPSIGQRLPYGLEMPMPPHVTPLVLNSPPMNTFPHVQTSQSQPQIPTQTSLKAETPPLSKLAASLSPSHTSPHLRQTPREIKPKPTLGRSSISNLMNSPEPQLFDKAPLPRIVQKSVSPPMPKLPTQGNFQTHKRSKSTPEVKKRTKSFTSPGPANVTLARGINLQTGERNSNNAMIAAAALAAAADIPLPLKHVEQSITIKNIEKTSPSPVQPVFKEEDQVTEPEDDAKTEDERTDEEQGTKTEDESIAVQKEPAEPIIQENKIEVKQLFVAPPLESFKVDPDSGLIGCICGLEDDDGFTIQCDVCYRWQHCLCMGFKTNEEVPEEEYQCYYCDHAKWGKFDPEACKNETLNRLDADKSGLDDDSPQSQKRQQQIQQLQKQREQNGAKRKVLNSDKSDKKRKIEIDPEMKNEIISEPTIIDTLPNKENELLKDGMTAESYQSVYFNVRFNDYKRPSIKEFILSLGSQFYADYLALPKAEQKKSYLGIEIMTTNQFKALKLSQIILPNNQKWALENKKNGAKKEKFNKTSVQVKSYSDNQKQKFNGISKLSLFISSNSPETLTIAEETPIIEYLGEIDLFENYAKDKINQYSLWGTMKPKVLKTNIHSKEKDVDIVVDSRFVSNESRFIRKSCPSTANCKIKQVYIPEKNSFHFLVVTTSPIVLKSETADEELRLPWEWDSQHPIRKLYSPNNSEKFEQLSNSDKSSLISCIDNVLHFAECGCSTSSAYSTCAIFKVKKATSYLLRSTRKASSISNVNLTKSKEELILPKREKRFISWNERLTERDNYIRIRLSVTTDDIDESEVKEEEVEREAEEKENKSPLLFNIPYKQQLRAQAKNQELHIEEEDTTPQTSEVPFLIVPDVLIKIEKSIDEKLIPIVSEAEASILKKSAETVPGVTEKLIDDEIRSAVAATISAAVPTQTENPIESEDTAPLTAPVAHPVSETKEEEKVVAKPEETHPEPVQPKVVKKLSFADYKKKMK